MLWIILAISTAFLKALGEAFWKKNLSPKESSLDEYSLALWVRGMTVIPFLLLCLLAWFQYNLQWSFIFLALAILWNTITTITMLKAVKYSDISIVWPLWTLTLPFLFITGYIVTSELPNMYWALWVICIFIWSYFLWIEKWNTSFLAPIRKLYHDTWSRYMLITTLIWSITAPIDKLWVQNLWIIHWLFYVNLWVTILLFSYMYLSNKSLNLQNIFSAQNTRKIGQVTLVLWAGNIIQLLALKYTLVIYVISIKRASWIFSVILWALIFKEKNIVSKLIAASIMILWVGIITLFGNI